MTKKDIEFQCELAYQEKFLELIGKKVGDSVKCTFFINTGDRKHSYTSSVEGYGTIIRDEKGYAVLSNEEYRTSKEVSDRPWDRCCLKSHWEYKMDKCRSRINNIDLSAIKEE